MAELIDLVNAEGSIVAPAIPRHTAEQHKDTYMQIVIAVIFNGLGQVLVHERAATKSVNPVCIDHVCGAIQSGETPEEAAAREAQEAQEEVGIRPTGLQIIRQGINQYGRYCYLLTGQSDEQPGTNLDPDEVAWAAYYHPDKLRAAHYSGAMKFVDGFFEDVTFALQNKF